VTERLYYHDADLREFDARVVAISEPPGSRLIELDRTAFYPNSGGQPHDTGRLDDALVVSVDVVAETLWHTVVGGELQIGQTVSGRIDHERRRDHTQQHSAQHVLSAAFDRVGGLRTVSFHLGADISTIDLNQPVVSPSVLAEAERLAQCVVLEDRPVLIHFSDAADLDQATLRRATERSGTIRIVEIEDFDRSACGGTHVRRTGQIGPIKIRRVERRGSTTRVEFLAGWRALGDYSERLVASRSIADQLSVRDTDIGEAVSKLLVDLASLRAETTEQREAILTHEATELWSGASSLTADGRIRLIRKSYVNRSPTELKQLALRLVARDPVVALLGATGPTTSIVFAQTDGLPFDVSSILRGVVATLGGRGGGTRNLAQGGGPASESLDGVLDAAVQLLRAHCTNLPNVP
jgi:alanyl-tRNA synthetase